MPFRTSPPPPAGGQSAADRRLPSRALASLFAAGGLLVLLSIALPHPARMDEPAIAIIAACAVAIAALVAMAGERLPAWAPQVLLATGSVLIAAGVHYAEDGSSAYALFYLWVGIYAFYFFSTLRAVLQVAWVGAIYALALVGTADGGAGLTRWIVTMGTLVVAGVLVSRLVRQVRARAAESAEHAASLAAQAEDLRTIAEVARDLSGVTTAVAARPAICAAAQQVTGAKVTILFEPDASGRELVSTAIVGARHDPIRLPFAARSGTGVAYSTGQPFFVADLPGDPAVAQWVVEELGLQSALWQPVLRNRVSIGVMAVAWEQRVPAIDERIASLMSLLASEAAVAIERADLLARLETVARTDDLTGLSNRRAWEEELPRELARAERDGRPLCVAMLDLDRFKHFNDEQGHQAGDRLLKELAAKWRAALRPSDVLARYGGEEFIVALPSCDLVRAMDVVERLRSAVPTDQTCSAGVALWNGDETPEALVNRADAALYEAKNTGRDRSVAAT